MDHVSRQQKNWTSTKKTQNSKPTSYVYLKKKRTDNRRYTGISRMHTKIKGKKIFRKCGILWQKNKSSSAVRRIRFVHFHLGQDASGIWHIYNQSLRSRLKKYYIDVLNDYSSHLDSFMKIVQTKRFVSKR